MKHDKQKSTEGGLSSEAIFDMCPDDVFVFAANGRILHANRSAEEHYGYTLKELQSMSANDLAASDLRDEMPPYLRGTPKSGDRFRWRHRCKDSSELLVEIFPRSIEYQEQTAIFASVRPISENVRSEKGLDESAQRYRRLFENMPSGFVLFSVVKNDDGEPIDLEILAANEEFDQTTGVSLGGATDRRLTHVVPGIERDSARWIERYAQVALTGKTLQFEQGSELLGLTYFVTAYQAGPNQCAVHFLDITEKKRANDKLREHETFISGILGSISDGLFTLDKDWCFTFVNEDFTRRTGKQSEELLGHCVWDLFSEALRLQIDQFYRRAMTERVTVDYETFYPPLQKWFAARIYPLSDGGLMIYSKEVTDRKQAEEELRESEERLRLATELGGVAVWEYDFTTNSMTRSDNHDLLYGLERQEKWNFDTFLNATHPADREVSNRVIQSSVAPGGADQYGFEFRVVYPDTSVHWLMVTGTVIERNPQGQGTIVQGCLVDVTRLKETQSNLSDSETRFRALFEQAGVGVAQINVDTGGFVRINQRFCDILGYSREEAELLDFQTITHPDDLALGMDTLEAVRSERVREATLEKRYIRKDGGLVWVKLTTAAMWAPGETPNFLVTVAEDITGRKQAEEERQKFVMLADSSSEFIGMCDLEMQPTYVNAAGLRMVGLPDVAAACRVKVGDYFYPESREFIEEEFFPRVLREGHGQVEIQLRHFQTGEPIWMYYYLFSVCDDSGTAIGWATVSHDISKVRELEAQRDKDAWHLKRALVGTIDSIAATFARRDPYTSGHQKSVAQLAVAIGRELGLSEDALEGLNLGSTIHDIGKISIPVELLSKPTKLSDVEYQLIKEHSRRGYEIVKDIDFPWPIADMIFQHHERLDGSGYPQGLSGDAIILEARILSVADVVEAISSDRPYRAALGIEPALEIIVSGRGTEFDAQVVDACVDLFRNKSFVFDQKE